MNSFNSRPHEEVDKHNHRVLLRLSPFNSRPHEEVDQYIYIIVEDIFLSTHDLTRRSTLLPSVHTEIIFFQLTTSRGGRLIIALYVDRRLMLSTHDLTRRSTILYK